MIYKNKYFNREFASFYKDNKFDFNKIIYRGAFLALLSFGLHFVFQTLYDTVLTDVFPELMLPSFFSSIYTYTLVSFIYFIFHFLGNYTMFTFAEIRQNNWYVMSKSGYKIWDMLWAKLTARYIFVIMIYSVGFVLTILATALLKYTFVSSYIFPLFLMGIIDIFLIVAITMTASLYVDGKNESRFTIIVSALGIVIVKIVSNYYDIISNRVLMQNLANMFDFNKSYYIAIAAVVFIVCMILCISISKKLAGYYTVTPIKRGEEYYYIEKPERDSKQFLSKASSVTAQVLNIVIISVVAVLIAFNSFLLIISTAQKNANQSISGVIVLFFQSSTMEDEISKNDLIFLRELKDDGTEQYVPKAGDIVVFRYYGATEIARIQLVDTEIGNIIVDIDNYPNSDSKGTLRRVITAEDIYGEYIGRSRALGALVLFSNSLFGRIVMLLIPIVIIFYYRQIMEFLNKKTKKRISVADEEDLPTRD